jgi:hypothetical protein
MKAYLLLLPAAAAAAAAAAMLQVTPGSDDGWVKVKLTSAGTGWLGFGVAQQGEYEEISNMWCF